jgi:hypothetical protein
VTYADIQGATSLKKTDVSGQLRGTQKEHKRDGVFCVRKVSCAIQSRTFIMLTQNTPSLLCSFCVPRNCPDRDAVHPDKWGYRPDLAGGRVVTVRKQLSLGSEGRTNSKRPAA